LPQINPVKEGTKISAPTPVDLSRRPVVQVSLGCHVEGVALPHPDPLDPDTTVAGVRMRFARKPPPFNPEKIAKLRRFVDKWIKKNLVPISPDADTSVEEWLKNTNYPLWRKEELKKKWEEFTSLDDPSKKYRRCKSFMKDETYAAYKHARGINSRSDEFKCTMGPIFKLIEEQVYKCHHFIKHVPVADRPRVIQDLLYKIGVKYVATDYTAFESLFIKEIMEAIEFQLYDYMTQHLPEHQSFMKECYDTLGGVNYCDYKTFVVRLLATRMSGEMCTSLGNGFSNLMLMLFLCEEVGCTNIDGFVEGDDGIFSMVGDPPTAADFAELGMNIKIELHDRLSTASFCGIIFDEHDCINVTDPREVLAAFGWTTTNYAKASRTKLLTLLRCKGLSMAHQYPGCPIIGSLAQYALRVTRSYDVRPIIEKNHRFSMWERDQLAEAMKDVRKLKFVAPPMATRLLVEDRYDIPVSVQIQIESFLDTLDSLEPLDFEILREVCPVEWSAYFNDYFTMNKTSDKQLEFPTTIWNMIDGYDREW